jgi:hypothetical protein
VKAKLQIPKGWRRLREGAKFREGDMNLRDDDGFYWSYIPPWYVGEYVAEDWVIRKISK